MAESIASFILFLTFIFVPFLQFAESIVPQQEVEAVVSILAAMNATSWRFNGDNCNLDTISEVPKLSQEANASIGCNCNIENDTNCHVVRITHKFYSLDGVLSPELANLPFLRSFDVAYNFLQGTIPPEWGLTQLEEISLLGNRLTGEIPPELGNITTLTRLDLEANKLSGTIPPDLGRLINLQSLILSSNQLTGRLPIALGQLGNLTNFRINENNFSGSIPDFIQNWRLLSRLEIVASGLMGPIPSNISFLENLNDLRISDISGPTQRFPPLENATGLIRLILRNCNLSGELPDYIWQVRELELLDTSFNNLVGRISNNILGRSIRLVFLTGNMLNGDIPDALLVNGAAIDLSYNNFTWQGPNQPTCRQNTNIYLNLFRSSSTGNPIQDVLPCNQDTKCPTYACSVHVNCGGNDVTVRESNGRSVFYKGDADVDGGAAKLYESDKNWGFSSTGDFMDDNIFQNTRYVDSLQGNTSLSTLYTTARFSPLTLTYFGYCLENGEYLVNLHFAEIIFTNDSTYRSLGRRIFDIYIQGRRVRRNFNIEDEAGGVEMPVVVPFNVSVTDNILEIRFYWAGKGTTRFPTRGVYGPLVSAIDVNPYFKTCSMGGKKTKKDVYIGVGIGVPCLVLLILVILWWRKSFKGRRTNEKDFEGMEFNTISFSFKQLKSATDNFNPSNKIGEGGFGAVYKGAAPTVYFKDSLLSDTPNSQPSKQKRSQSGPQTSNINRTPHYTQSITLSHLFLSLSTATNMSPKPSENGTEGDDEREEGEEDTEEDKEEQEEEEEDEPRLKYQRMGGNVPSLLSSDAASCVAVAERMIALGTHGGTVHILDFLGNQVKEFRAHTAAVNDLCFDLDGEFIGSCSDDGSVVIISLFTDEKQKFEYHRPMKAIAIDPDYARKASRRFVTGGLAGNLYFNTKKWLGYRDQVLHSGEGPIHAVKWRTSLIAWANDAGVKVYDAANDQRVTFIERPRGSPRPELLLPHLVWQDDALLVIGWGTAIKIASIKTNQARGVNGSYRQITTSNMNQVDIVASFQTSYFISGVAPFGDSLVVLAYIPGEEDGEKEFSSSVPSRQGNAQRPEVHVVTWNNDELATDALPVLGFEHYKAKDYSLAHVPFTGSSYAGGQWAAGDEPLYYVVSPKDVVIAKPRDAEDHINWLLQHGWHEKALEAVEAGQGRSELLDEVGSRYLDHLIVERKYAEAASLCPKVLRGSAAAWERWVFHFAHLRQLPVLVPYIPTENPVLRDTAYEVALVALATIPSSHKDLLSAVKTWPPAIYSAVPIIAAIEPQLNTSSMTNELKEALAVLYEIDGQYEKAFTLYADLMKPDLFEFIEKHNLHDAIPEKVAHLMSIDHKRTVSMLIQHRDLITPAEVVSQLLAAKKQVDSRYFLHEYLHALFEANPHAGRDFHDMQVELYAEYDIKMLLPFLRSSQHYMLEKAYEVCLKKNLLSEQVFILGRMGNAKQALAVIIDKQGDIKEAVEFVSMQHDDDLWEELIRQCLDKPEMVGVLLEHTVGNLDPLYIVNIVPNGLEIPRLRDRLVKIITDYRTETSLRHGCNDILKADIVNLLVKYYKEARRAIYLTDAESGTRSNTNPQDSNPMDRPPVLKTMETKSKTRADGRCCICFEPLPIQTSVIVFFCCHAYHLNCLIDSTNSITTNKQSSDSYENGDYIDDENDQDTPSAGSRMRCVLCTTAAAG